MRARQACKEGDLSKLQAKLATGGMNVNIVVAAHQRKMLSAAGKSLIGRTPAQLAALGGHDACLKLLLSSNASPERNEDEIMSPLFAAIAGSSADRSSPKPNPDCAIAGSSADRAATCRVLLEAKADENEEDDDSETNALHQVALALGPRQPHLRALGLAGDRQEAV